MQNCHFHLNSQIAKLPCKVANLIFLFLNTWCSCVPRYWRWTLVHKELILHTTLNTGILFQKIASLFNETKDNIVPHQFLGKMIFPFLVCIWSLDKLIHLPFLVVSHSKCSSMVLFIQIGSSLVPPLLVTWLVTPKSTKYNYVPVHVNNKT